MPNAPLCVYPVCTCVGCTCIWLYTWVHHWGCCRVYYVCGQHWTKDLWAVCSSESCILSIILFVMPCSTSQAYSAEHTYYTCTYYPCVYMWTCESPPSTCSLQCWALLQCEAMRSTAWKMILSHLQAYKSFSSISELNACMSMDWTWRASWSSHRYCGASH